VSSSALSGHRATLPRVIDWVVDGAMRAMDSAILWQLGSIGVATSDEADFPPVDPTDFWRDARLDPPLDIRVITELGRRLDGTVRSFDVEGESHGPGVHPGSTKFIARAHLRDRDPDAPFVLVLHGYGVPSAFYEEAHCRTLNRAGASAVRLDNPWHLRRRARGQRSGAGFMTADPRRLLASAKQAVEDAAAVVAWGRTLSSRVSVVGVSLGGLIACLLAAQVELDSVVAVAPFCDPSYTLINNLPSNLRRQLGLTGTRFGVWGEDRESAVKSLEGALAPVICRNFTHPATSPERIALVCPSNDLVVGPQPIIELARAWGTEMWDERHSHISILRDRALTTRIDSWLLADHPAREVPAAGAR